jgi:hypothetical protein
LRRETAVARKRSDRFAYFVHFGAGPEEEAKARRFADALPVVCTSEIHPPGYGNDDLPPSDDDGWTVLVRGPWADPDDGEGILMVSAVHGGGTYDGWEEMPPA